LFHGIFLYKIGKILVFLQIILFAKKSPQCPRTGMAKE